MKNVSLKAGRIYFGDDLRRAIGSELYARLLNIKSIGLLITAQFNDVYNSVYDDLVKYKGTYRNETTR